MPSTLSVTNGSLRIRASMLPQPQGRFTIAGGAVVSQSEKAFFGYYEARMKASKISMSSTFWMSNRTQRENEATVSHEIDITETVGALRNGPAWSRDWNRFMNANTHYFHNRAGQSWKFEAITSGSQRDNIRPYVVLNHAPNGPTVLWQNLSGRYVHYTNYRASIKTDRPGQVTITRTVPR